jgi:hypothetical protein
MVMGMTDAQLGPRSPAGACSIAEKASAADIAGYLALMPSAHVATAWLGTCVGRLADSANLLHIAATFASLDANRNPCG